MRLALSLRWAVVLIFLGVGLALVIGYTQLTKNYFFQGMDSAHTFTMEQLAKHYLQTEASREVGEYSGSETKPQSIQRIGYQLSSDWDQLPARFRESFEVPPAANQLIKKFVHWPGERHRVLQFLFNYTRDGKTVYVTHEISHSTRSELVGQMIRESRARLWLISLGSALALTLIILLLLRQVWKPVDRLLNWTRQLNPDSLQRSPPGFQFPELNQLAKLIRDSLNSVQLSLEREHRFLRHTSHELRTPISTITSNVELLRKLREQISVEQALEVDLLSYLEKEQTIIERIGRASLTMKHLTETLLWLSKDQQEPLQRHQINLSQLIEELIDSMQYLLNDKPVTVNSELEVSGSATLNLPEVAVRIVLGNLIRNAFQHCWEGEITISQKGRVITISNPRVNIDDTNAKGEEPDERKDDQGFGLGLQLTEQLCERLNWPYLNRASARQHLARVEVL